MTGYTETDPPILRDGQTLRELAEQADRELVGLHGPWYYGPCTADRSQVEVFRAWHRPTEQSHGKRYSYCTGPSPISEAIQSALWYSPSSQVSVRLPGGQLRDGQTILTRLEA